MKFYKKYIKALKEGSLAVKNDGTNNLLFQIIIATGIGKQAYGNHKYIYFTKEGMHVESNQLPVGMVAKSAKDFIKLSIETLTENDVVVCENRTQYEKVKKLPNIANCCIVGDTGHFKDKNIIPYRDLFPKKKKPKYATIEHSNNALSIHAEKIKALQERVKILEDGNRISIDLKDTVFNEQSGTYTIHPDYLFKGKAEQPKTDAIDWDKPRQLFTDGKSIVLSTGSHSDNRFQGVIIQTKVPNVYVDLIYFRKDEYVLCTEDITIKINE